MAASSSSSNAPRLPALTELVVADSGKAWSDAGFCVDHDGSERLVHVGGIVIRLGSTDEASHAPETPKRPGILRWSMAGLAPGWKDTTEPVLTEQPTNVGARAPQLLDGLETCFSDQSCADKRTEQGLPNASKTRSQDHENLVTNLDHVVVTTRNMQRTIAEFERAGFVLRRIRDITPNQQAFFWAGDTIIEVVGPAESQGELGSARLWGLAMTSSDLDAAARHLGNRLGPINNAVQPGRRIATLRGNDLGLSVPLVLMSDHRKDADNI